MSDRRATCIASHRPDHHAGSRGGHGHRQAHNRNRDSGAAIPGRAGGDRFSVQGLRRATFGLSAATILGLSIAVRKPAKRERLLSSPLLSSPLLGLALAGPASLAIANSQ